MIKRYATITLIISSAIIFPNTFLNLGRAWANPVIAIIPTDNGLRDIIFGHANNDMYATNVDHNTVSVISLFTPPTDTTITSSIDGNGKPIQNGGSTFSTSITFHVTAKQGTNTISGFQCKLDINAFEPCAVTDSGIIIYNNLTTGRQHTFQVRAVDDQGNIGTNLNFTWIALTSNQEIQKLIATIETMHLYKTKIIDLEVPLKISIKFLNDHQNAAACYTLTGFLQMVNADELSGQITAEQAVELRQVAIIQRTIGCSPSFSLFPPALTSWSSLPPNTANE